MPWTNFLLALCLQSTSATVIENVTVIDGTGAAARTSHSVLIRGARVVSVRPTEEITVPEGATRIDATGKFLIPGLWDMHVHVCKVRRPALPMFVWHGVTTVRDMGGELSEIRGWQQAIERGELAGPTIYTSGPYLESARRVKRLRRSKEVEPYARTRFGVGTKEDAWRLVGNFAKQGVDFIKIRTFESRASYLAIGEAAAAHGLPLVGHAMQVAPEDVLRSGQRSVEHGIYPPLQRLPHAKRTRLCRDFARRGVAFVPTLVGLEATLVARSAAKKALDDDGTLYRWRKYLAAYTVADWREQVAERQQSMIGFFRIYGRDLMADTRELRAAGARILPGSDTAILLVWPGASLHDELAIFVEKLGMTPMEAIVSATRHAAEFMGVQRDFGTVLPGRIADLVLLDKNPLRNIRNTQAIHSVIRRGQVFDPERREQLLREVATMPELETNDWHKSP